jgi:shikimate dehydrogenase
MVREASGQVLRSPARHAAVLGSPINHSLSPALHLAAYRALGLTHWSYGSHELRAPDLSGFVGGLGPGWAGLSLTMPLKEVAFEVADEVSKLAREVGAINTLTRRPDGGWSGDNTDVYGVAQALRAAGCDRVPSAVVLGSGATARSVVAALATLGCVRVTFGVRAAARQETLEQARGAGLDVAVVRLGDLSDALGGDAQVVVSTLPGQALSGDAVPANVLAGWVSGQGSRPLDHLLLDVVYSGWPTPLARAFQEAGASVVSGLEMLVHQAAEQVRLMTGLCPPVDEMRAAGLAELGSR